MNLRSLRIGVRLGIGFGAILTMLLVLLLADSFFSARNRQQMNQGIELSHIKSSLASALKSNLMESAITLRNIGLQTDMAEIEKLKLIIKAQKAQYKEIREKLIATGLSSDENAIIETINQLDALVDVPAKAAYKMILQFDGENAAKLIATEIDPIQQKSIKEISKLVELQAKFAQGLTQETEQRASQLSLILFAISGAMLLIGGAFSYYTTRSITQPLLQALEIAKRVAAGDLSAHEVCTGSDEISQLLNALTEMNDNLHRIVSEVRSGTDTIALSSAEIASGNADLSSRTETQAGALEETASSMEQITATVRNNADNTRQANTLVESACAFAVQGGEEVGKVVTTMNSIKDSSRKIVDIIAVIDGIAFQTNILALNAAVEAARAGEQGRGFAVVASEVRNLAQRSASAAKEIKNLITDSVEKVDNGAKLVDAAGATMQEIVKSVKHVADIMVEMSAAGNEQRLGIEEVNRAITQMDEMTQQNSALVEQAAAAAGSMEDQAKGLAQTVASFKLQANASGKVYAVKSTSSPAARISKSSKASSHTEVNYPPENHTLIGKVRQFMRSLSN